MNIATLMMNVYGLCTEGETGNALKQRMLDVRAQAGAVIHNAEMIAKHREKK